MKEEAERFLSKIQVKYRTVKRADVTGKLVDAPLADILEAFTLQILKELEKDAQRLEEVEGERQKLAYLAGMSNFNFSRLMEIYTKQEHEKESLKS